MRFLRGISPKFVRFKNLTKQPWIPHLPSEGQVKTTTLWGTGASAETLPEAYTPPLREDKWGRLGDSCAPPPPLGITSEVWMQARHKPCPLGDDRPALPMFATPGDWQPTLGEFKKRSLASSQVRR